MIAVIAQLTTTKFLAIVPRVTRGFSKRTKEKEGFFEVVN